MKMLNPLLGRNSQISYIALMGIFYFPRLMFGIESIGTIGQPRPEQRAFLSNKTICWHRKSLD